MRVARELQSVALERSQVVRVAQLLAQALEVGPVARPSLGPHRLVEVATQVGGHAVVVEQRVVHVDQEHHLRAGGRAHARAPPPSGGFSWWPPNSNRSAESRRFAKSDSPREVKRS